jgi:hypothetical protein
LAAKGRDWEESSSEMWLRLSRPGNSWLIGENPVTLRRDWRSRKESVVKELKRLGWRVIRFWESSLGDEEDVIARLKLLI